MGSALLLAALALPTLYQHYTKPVIKSGLSISKPYFTLNGRNITIYSGAMHYFRIPARYWRDRLRKLRAAGLNTVDTYMPWNLHEPTNGTFDFGAGHNAMSAFLDLKAYLQLAREEDLFVIARPGPFICAEWEWGGLPSWLLREEAVRIRTSNANYMRYVERYFQQLIPLLADFQFTNGGPVIMVQVENEYGSAPIIDWHHMRQLYAMLRANGIRELLVTSDSHKMNPIGTLPGKLLKTVNFKIKPEKSLRWLNHIQRNKPLMVMEYWAGWFDHWSENHNTVNINVIRKIYKKILKYKASVNMYMFHGGTNFGFMNGANQLNHRVENKGDYEPTTTSYDYDAPLNEAGDYTDKYYVVKELIRKYNPVNTLTPEMPKLIPRTVYPELDIIKQLSFTQMISQIKWSLKSNDLVTMEDLSINQDSGQSYGYIGYDISLAVLEANSVLTIENHVCDTVMVLLNGKLVSKPLTSRRDLDGFGYWRQENSKLALNDEKMENVTLTLVIENAGRMNFGTIFQQKKGLTKNNTIYINEKKLNGLWKIYPIEFKKAWNQYLKGWQEVYNGLVNGPGLYKAVLTIDEYQEYYNDTYVNMYGWSKGIVIVNGFVIGRYSLLGPQQSLYLPGPFLQHGDNEILIFEHFSPQKSITFSSNLLFY